jgi:hypothetical protein
MAAPIHLPVGIGTEVQSNTIRAMASVKVHWVASGQCVGQQALVCIDVQTSVGNCAFPFQVDDRGSEQANEQEARRELRVFLCEAMQALGES